MSPDTCYGRVLSRIGQRFMRKGRPDRYVELFSDEPLPSKYVGLVGIRKNDEVQDIAEKVTKLLTLTPEQSLELFATRWPVSDPPVLVPLVPEQGLNPAGLNSMKVKVKGNSK